MNNEVTIYIPKIGVFMEISEGSGDNLLPEDEEEGYVDYINYEIYEYVQMGEMKNIDGGMLMLTELFVDKYHEESEFIKDVIQFHYDKDYEYVIISREGENVA